MHEARRVETQTQGNQTKTRIVTTILVSKSEGKVLYRVLNGS